MNKKSVYIMISIVVFSIFVCLIDAIIQPNYFVKIPIKILFLKEFKNY